MAKKPSDKKRPKPQDVETEPDGWERFEKAVNKMVPPRPKQKEKPKK